MVSTLFPLLLNPIYLFVYGYIQDHCSSTLAMDRAMKCKWAYLLHVPATGINFSSVRVIGARNFANTIQIYNRKSIIMTEAWRLQSDIDNWQLCWKYLVELLGISTGLRVICFLWCRQIRSCNTHICLVSMLDSFVCHQPPNHISTGLCTTDCSVEAQITYWLVIWGSL